MSDQVVVDPQNSINLRIVVVGQREKDVYQPSQSIAGRRRLFHVLGKRSSRLHFELPCAVLLLVRRDESEILVFGECDKSVAQSDISAVTLLKLRTQRVTCRGCQVASRHLDVFCAPPL